MMKNWFSTGCIATALAVSTTAWAADFHVDPNTGSMQNDGSEQHPWRTLQEVIEANLIETQGWESLPPGSQTKLVPKNQGAPVKAGDTLWLHDGYHGEILIRGAYNAKHITIAAAQGQTPKIRALHVQGGSHWTFRGLSISPEHAPPYEKKSNLVFFENHSHQGPSHDIVLEDSAVFSMNNVSAWSKQDWNDLPCNGIRVSGNDCIIRNNEVRNIDFGISASGKNVLVEYNTVDSFAGDGLRGLGDYGVFQYNIVKNNYDVNENHDDGFQSWSLSDSGKVGQGEVVGIVLRGNTFINYEDPAQPFRGPMQGIGCFDGMFVDWIVENNVVITDHWHGITLMGAKNSRIINNTVLDPNDQNPGPPWIRISAHKDGTKSEGCVIRNNLTTAMNTPDDQDVQIDNNIIFKDPSEHFVDVANHDVKLISTSPAIDVGSADLAPALDRDEVPRPQGDGIDIGAYEYYEGSPEVPDAGAGGSSGVGGAAGSGGQGGNGTGDAGANNVAGAGGKSEPLYDGGVDASTTPSDSDDDGGCGCRMVSKGVSTEKLLFLPLAWLVIRRRKRAYLRR